MKKGVIVLILFLISLIVWPEAVIGLILIFCIIGVVVLTMGKIS